MTVNSIPFLIFFIVVFSFYYLFKRSAKTQQFILLIFSYLFYGYADLKMLWLLVVTTVVFYGLGLAINASGTARKKNVYTGLAVVTGGALLLYFKYLNFFVQSSAGLFSHIGLQTNWETFHIIMPLGISFFTFKLISYAVDVRQGNLPVEKNFVTFAAYVSFFPTILSGPIDRACDFIPQLKTAKAFDYALAVDGCRQILWGMFKKMVVADGLSLFIQRDVETSTGSTLVIVAVFYSIQLYADFSGYSDMAIGVGKLLGFRITRNFCYPYFSQNIADFWHRWHISLLSWFRHYIYFPLGGSRCSKVKAIRNTFVVFLVSGLWHGANWTFVIWGLYHALLFMPRLLKKKKTPQYKLDEKYPLTLKSFLNIAATFILVVIGWVIFRSNSISEFWEYMCKISSSSLFSRPSGVMWALPSFIAAVFMFAYEWMKRDMEHPLQMMTRYRCVRWACYLLLIAAIVFYQGKPAEFIYFKF